MKRFFLFPVFFVLILSACSSEEPIPFDYVQGRFEGYRASLSVNGVNVPNPVVDIEMHQDERELSRGDVRGLATVKLCQVCFIVLEDHPLFPEEAVGMSRYMPVEMQFIAEVNSFSDRITFNGEETLLEKNGDVVRYVLNGEYVKAPIGDTPLKISINSEVRSNKLTGRAFEMRFYEDAFDTSCQVFENRALPNTGKLPEEVFDEFCRLLPANYMEKTGIDALRFTFNENGSMDVLAHDIASGNYISQETNSTYQPVYPDRVFFMQDAEWTESFIACFSPYSSSSKFSLPLGFYEIGLTAPGVKDKGVMQSYYRFEENSLIITPSPGLIHNNWVSNPSWAFISSWPIKSGYTEVVPGKDLFDDMMYAIREGWLECEVRFVAHPV